jgi:arsenate reductase
MKVLFLCTGNSARSQMAEAFLRRYGGEWFTAHSAGLSPSTIRPHTVRVMDELGFDLSEHRAKSVKEFLGGMNFAYVVTVCAKAEENCPSTFPGRPLRVFWSFDDPAAFAGDNAAKLQKFRVVRDEIRARVQA